MGNSSPPRKPKNLDVRPRGEYLTNEEVRSIADAASKVGRHGHRDEWMIWVGYRHGLRVSELVELKREQADLKRGSLRVNRLKGSLPSTHDMSGPEIRAFKRLVREYPESPYLFVSEMGGPLTPSGVTKILARAARSAGMTIKVHPHMLRHSCGFALANAGRDLRAIQAWLGHADIHHTVRYTALAEGRLKGLFPD